MLREQILETWTRFKNQILTKLKLVSLVHQQITLDQLESQIQAIDTKLWNKRNEFKRAGSVNTSSSEPTVEEVNDDELVLYDYDNSYRFFTPEQKKELDQIKKTREPLYQQLTSARLVMDTIKDVLTERKKLENRLTEEEKQKAELMQKLVRIKDLIIEGRINTVKQMVKEGGI